MAEQVAQPKLGRHGGDRRSERAKADRLGHENDVSKLKPSEANTKVYWLARLDRDGHAELAAKVRAGELSATAAAIEVGYCKPPRKTWARRRRFDAAALIG